MAETTRQNPLAMFGRALLLRCPRCGGRGLFLSWFKLMLASPFLLFPISRLAWLAFDLLFRPKHESHYR